MNVEDLPAAARAFLESLDTSHGDVVIEDGGTPRFVVADGRALEQRRNAKQLLFAVVDRIRQRHATVDSEEILRDLESVE